MTNRPCFPASRRCSPKEQSDDARFSDVHKAVELVATEQQNLSARTEKSLSEQEERLSELETALQAQQTAFNELVDKLSHEDSRRLPPACNRR